MFAWISIFPYLPVWQWQVPDWLLGNGCERPHSSVPSLYFKTYHYQEMLPWTVVGWVIENTAFCNDFTASRFFLREKKNTQGGGSLAAHTEPRWLAGSIPLNTHFHSYHEKSGDKLLTMLQIQSKRKQNAALLMVACLLSWSPVFEHQQHVKQMW